MPVYSVPLAAGWHGHALLRGHALHPPGAHGHATARGHATRHIGGKPNTYIHRGLIAVHAGPCLTGTQG